MNIEPKPLQSADRLFSFKEMLSSGIVIGSIARGEFSPLYAGYDNLQKINLSEDENGNIYWCDCDYDNNPTSEWIIIDEYNHPDMILDAFTLNPDFKDILFRAKSHLIGRLRSKTKSRIKSLLTQAKSNIKKGGTYKIRGENHIQYKIEEELFFIDTEYCKSVKYTYLRALQLFLIRMLLLYIPHYFELESQPTTRSKINTLVNSNILLPEEAEKLLSAYEEIILIYGIGVQEYYSRPTSNTTFEYRIEDAQRMLSEAEFLIDSLSYKYFTQKSNEES